MPVSYTHLVSIPAFAAAVHVKAVPPSARARRAPDRQSGRAGRGEREGTGGLRAARAGQAHPHRGGVGVLPDQGGQGGAADVHVHPCLLYTSKIAASSDTGTVSFTDIPAGHTYTLTETLPEGDPHDPASIGAVTVKVSGGAVYVNVQKNPTDLKLENTYLPGAQDLTVTKQGGATPDGLQTAVQAVSYTHLGRGCRRSAPGGAECGWERC